MEKLIKVERHSHKKISKFEKKTDNQMDLINVLEENLSKHLDKEKLDAIKEKLNWNYKYQTSVGVITKSSVSKIKKEIMDSERLKTKHLIFEDDFNQINEKNNLLNLKINQEEKITQAQKGTLTHLILQKLDEKKQDYKYEDIKNLIEDLVFRRIITNKEAEAINIKSVLDFTKSDLYKELSMAKKVYKEQPFYINMKAKDVYDTESEDLVLVQGVIDLYFVDKNDNIILVDYKTDNIENETELVERYKEQLNLYKIALEKALNKKVDKVLIYSIKLKKEIELL